MPARGRQELERRTSKAACMLAEFRAFLIRGNVVDLAVGLIAGAVFGAVVKSLVEDIVMPLVTAIVGKPDYSDLSFTLNGSVIGYGSFITALITFVLTMGAVFFFIVKPINALTARVATPSEGGEPDQRECPECLSEVPVKAHRCRYCTTPLAPAVPD